MKAIEIAEHLEEVPLFRHLSGPQLMKLARVTRLRDARAKEVIVREGTYRSGGGPAFFLIAEGKAEVMVKRKKVASLKEGDYFGEMSLLDGQPRSATVTAVTPMVLLRILSVDFLRLIKSEPSVAIGLLKTMAGWLREAHKRKYD